MERVFDICHGCRRCVSLCQSFPNLFDLVDATADGEVHGVDKKDYAKVVDQCYLCDLCYMTKCPYVPPHPWQLDFPHLMLRAKAIKYRKGEVGGAEKLLAATDVHGQFAGIPIVIAGGECRQPDEAGAQGARRHARRPSRGLAAGAGHPALPLRRGEVERRRPRSSTASAARARSRSSRPASSTTTSPASATTCCALLEHNAIPYEIVEKESCCGMPKLELGDLEGVAKHKEANIPVLARYAREGWAIVSAVPSCTLMFKQELPLMFPDEADVKAVQAAMFDPFEYLVARHRDGLLKTDFKTPLGKVSYHIPCHGRVQKIGRKTEEMFKLIGKTVAVELNTVERCSGHAGTYGVKTPTHPVAMKIGTPVFKSMANGQPAYISSDCPMAGHHIAQGMEVNQLPAAELRHPLSLIALAYGLVEAKR